MSRMFLTISLALGVAAVVVGSEWPDGAGERVASRAEIIAEMAARPAIVVLPAALPTQGCEAPAPPRPADI